MPFPGTVQGPTHPSLSLALASLPMEVMPQTCRLEDQSSRRDGVCTIKCENPVCSPFSSSLPGRAEGHGRGTRVRVRVRDRRMLAPGPVSHSELAQTVLGLYQTERRERDRVHVGDGRAGQRGCEPLNQVGLGQGVWGCGAQ